MIYCRGVKGQFGGRCANILAMILNYASLLCWIFALACTASLCFVYRVFDRLCYPIIRFSDSTCFDFTVFQPLVEPFSSKVGLLIFFSESHFIDTTNFSLQLFLVFKTVWWGSPAVLCLVIYCLSVVYRRVYWFLFNCAWSRALLDLYSS